MDFTSALLYPYKSIAKVLTIVLVMTIAIAVFLGMLLNSYDWVGFIQTMQYNLSISSRDYLPEGAFARYETPTGMFIPALIGLMGVMIAQGLWLSGYGIRVIRSVMEGNDKLPNVQLGKDMMTGLSLFIGNIVYALLFVPFFIIVGMLMAMTSANDGSGLSALLFCGSFLVAIPLMMLMGWAFFVGMARSAADNNRGALFEIGKNFSIARQNVKASFSLTGYMILLGLTFWFVSQFVSNVLQLFTRPFLGGSQDQMSILIAVLIPLMLSIAMNIVQEFSKMHLIAQYGYQIGLYDDFDDFEPKKVDFDFE